MLDPFRKNPAKSAEEQSADLQALVAASREERAALSTMLGQAQARTSKLIGAGRTVQELDAAITKLDQRAEQVKDRLDRLQEGTSALADDLRNMHDVSRLIRDETAAVAEVARDIEQRLGSLEQFQRLSRAADEQLTALHALASQAAEKMRAFAEQAQLAEHAVEQSARLDAAMRRMEAHVATLEQVEQRAKDALALVEQARERQDASPVQPVGPAGGIRSNALVDMLDDLRASVDAMATRAGIPPFAAASCTRLRDMAHEAQSAIAALHHGA